MVLDTSVLINLVASGIPRQILEALATRCLVAEQVVGELTDGGALLSLYADGLLKRVPLPDSHLELFLNLVSGAPDDLGDGEAATIALAVSAGLPACLDDKKARRVCASRFASVPRVCTVELLQTPRLVEMIGPAALEDAVYRALAVGRMHAPGEHQPWIESIVGAARLATCPSWPRRR